MLKINDQNALAGARHFSKQIAPGNFLVAYADKKNGRIVLALYPNNEANCKRIAGQIRMFKAAVFEAGRRLDDSQFTNGRG